MPAQLRQFAVALARTMARGQVDHEDLAHVALERWCRHGGASIPNPRAWLTLVLRRLLIDQLRRRRAAPEVLAPVDCAFAAHEPEASPWWCKLEVEVLRQELGCLRPEVRETFELFSFGARSYEQIARELNIAKPTVGSRISRARLQLRSRLLARARRGGFGRESHGDARC